jgi:hypothetical protein
VVFTAHEDGLQALSTLPDHVLVPSISTKFPILVKISLWTRNFWLGYIHIETLLVEVVGNTLDRKIGPVMGTCTTRGRLTVSTALLWVVLTANRLIIDVIIPFVLTQTIYT